MIVLSGKQRSIMHASLQRPTSADVGFRAVTRNWGAAMPRAEERGQKVSAADVGDAGHANAEVARANDAVQYTDFQSVSRLQYLLFHFFNVCQQAVPLIRQVTDAQQRSHASF